MAECRTCHQEIVWATNPKNDKLMPVDPKPVGNGNVQLYQGNVGLYASVLAGERLRAAQQANVELHLSHFVTCPQSSGWRRR